MNNVKTAPFIHGNENLVKLKMDLLVGLLAIIIIATVQNGFRVISLCGISAASSWVFETLGLLIFRRGRVAGIRSISMGIIIAMFCPVTVPIWLPATAAAISVVFVDVLLSVNYRQLFMTPAIGWLFMMSIAPDKMTGFPAVRYFGAFEVFKSIENYQSAHSIAQCLQSKQVPPYNFLNLLTGDYPGGIGTTCILGILAVCVYFIVRKTMAWQVSLSMILTVTVIALFINRTNSSPLYSVLFELTASSFIFVAVFVAGDIINAPMLTTAKIVYGFLIGLLTMLFRYAGFAEHCVVMALVITNLLSGLLDLAALKLQIKKQRKKEVAFSN